MSSPRSGLIDLAEYFDSWADRLNDEAHAQKIFMNSDDRGENKEIILQGFLEGHLPKRCDIFRGGYIFDSFGNKSSQIDLIVTSEFTLQFKQTIAKSETKSFNCVEGSIAAISVKSTLDKKQLCEAIDNLASLPTAKYYLQLDPHDQMTYEVITQTPFKVIFAYKGVNVKALLRDLKIHLKNNKIPIDRAPDLIIVNKRCYISKKQNGHFSRNIGDYSAGGSYLATHGSKHIGGLALVSLVSAIQRLSNLGSLVMLNFYEYQRRIEISVANNDLKREQKDAKEFFADADAGNDSDTKK